MGVAIPNIGKCLLRFWTDMADFSKQFNVGKVTFVPTFKHDLNVGMLRILSVTTVNLKGLLKDQQ